MSAFQPVTALGGSIRSDAHRRTQLRWRLTERLLTGAIGAAVLTTAVYLGATGPTTSPVAPPAAVAASSGSTAGPNSDGLPGRTVTGEFRHGHGSDGHP